jgi:hypothetical protein
MPTLPLIDFPAVHSEGGEVRYLADEHEPGAETPAYLAPPAAQDLLEPSTEVPTEFEETADAAHEGLTGWAMEWADETPSGAQAPALQYDAPVLTQAITDAVEQKNWPKVLELALQVGWHDENKLTNLLFYGRHPELGGRDLDPRHSLQDRTLGEEWKRIRKTEVRPAIHRASVDRALEVPGDLVAERDPLFAGAQGDRFRALVASVAAEVTLDPGFVAAVLLAEVDNTTEYLSMSEVRSFRTGTDDFLEQRAQLAANVPAFAKVRFDARRKTTNINEHDRRVTTVPFATGRDAALATAVYLKWAEIKLTRAFSKNGGDYQALPVPTRFVLNRVAMAAGHGAIGLDGELIWLKKKGGRFVRAKEGEKGAVLLGVAGSVRRVLDGKDILVRNWERRGDPTGSSHITHRNATILASQALHLGEWFFRAPALGVQPEVDSTIGRSRTTD